MCESQRIEIEGIKVIVEGLVKNLEQQAKINARVMSNLEKLAILASIKK